MVTTVPGRDALLTDFGKATLEDRYLLPGESYQDLFARVAATYADDPEHAQRVYDYMSQLWFMPATPVLSNGGANRGLPISCFLNAVPDSMVGITATFAENMALASNGGGIGTYWGGVRSIGERAGPHGQTSGIIPFIKGQDSLTLAVNQGSLRRGSAAVYIDIHHPEIEEFVEIRKPTGGDENRKSLNIHHGINITDEFMHAVEAGAEFALRSPKTGEVLKTVDAWALWTKILEIRLQTGEPYLNFIDTVNRAMPAHQKALGLQVRQSNLCVAPETKILTDKGHETIKDLAGQKVNAWNGFEFSEVDVVQTGVGQELIEVQLSDGAKLSCTPYHKFYVVSDYWKDPVEVRAGDLTPGMKLMKGQLPVVQGGVAWDHAYLQGFFSGDGFTHNGDQYLDFYSDKKAQGVAFIRELGDLVRYVHNNDTVDRLRVQLKGQPFHSKFTVPHQGDLSTRLNWFAGLCDSDGCVTRNGDTQSIQISSINSDFLDEVRLMLQTLGVASKVRLAHEGGPRTMPDGRGGYSEYECQPIWRLMFGEAGIQQLISLGFSPLRIAVAARSPQREASQYVKVESVTHTGRVDDTYCFTEPKRGLGVFNGVLTGQCTEITLHTGVDHRGNDRTAVCCLSSVNAETYLQWKDHPTFIEDVMRFLDNVLQDFIDRAPSEIDRASYAAMRERSVGLGLMGFHSFLQSQYVAFGSAIAKAWNIRIFKHLRRAADEASQKLALEKGPCPDAADAGAMERFSHKLAIAPTASISIICGGTSAGIEPIPANIYTHKTQSGSFVVKNRYLEKLLEQKGQNTSGVWDSILENQGSVQHLDYLTDYEKATFQTAFEIDQRWVIEHAADRTPSIDQAQSVNIFLPGDVDKWDLHMLHWQAWEKGLKSLYYLRSRSVQQASFAGSSSSPVQTTPIVTAPPTNYEECLACQ